MMPFYQLIKCLIHFLEKGRVYAFGEGSNGQLGQGTNILKSDKPLQVRLKDKIKLVSCGENHTALVSSK